MKFLFVLALLSVVLISSIGIIEVFDGGAAYENRANGYWMQIYTNIAITIGIMTAGSVLLYKILKGKLNIYKKTTDMRKSR